MNARRTFRSNVEGMCDITGRSYPAGTQLFRDRDFGWCIADEVTEAAVDEAARLGTLGQTVVLEEVAYLQVTNDDDYGRESFGGWQTGELVFGNWQDCDFRHQSGWVVILTVKHRYVESGDVGLFQPARSAMGNLWTAQARRATPEEISLFGENKSPIVTISPK